MYSWNRISLPSWTSLPPIQAVTIDCADPLALARFWGAVFGTEIESTEGEGPHYVDLETRPGLPTLRFQRVPEQKIAKDRLHLDMIVEDVDQACERIEALGGRRVPGEPFEEYGYRWAVMQDPEGNEFCVGRSSTSEA